MATSILCSSTSTSTNTYTSSTSTSTSKLYSSTSTCTKYREPLVRCWFTPTVASRCGDWLAVATNSGDSKTSNLLPTFHSSRPSYHNPTTLPGLGTRSCMQCATVRHGSKVKKSSTETMIGKSFALLHTVRNPSTCHESKALHFELCQESHL